MSDDLNVLKSGTSSQQKRDQKYKRPGVAIALDNIGALGLVIGTLTTIIGILDKTLFFAVGLSAIISSLLFIGLAAIIDNLSKIAHWAKRASSERTEIIRALQWVIDNWKRKE
jgi:hypothetical protein